jgi:SPP1 gp7 family putative phage head morphogenesis protein
MSLFATFTEALIQAKRRKLELPRDYYAKIPANARARSFTVSGLAGIAQIGQVLDDLTGAIQDGQTFEQWKKKALLGTPELYRLPKGRLSTIYRNAMLNAYNAGRYEQMRATPNRKFWLYDGIIDSRTTEICRALDGKIYPADSPVWRRIHPPNHHNCRSTLIGLTEAQAKARGYRPGTPDAVPPEGEPEGGWASNPAIGLNEAINAAATAGNTALGRQYAPLVLKRQAMVDFGREIARAQAAGAEPDILEMLAAMLAALLLEL